MLLVFSLVACQMQIEPRDIVVPRPEPDPNSPLIGTRWTSQTEVIYFESAERLIWNNTTGLDYWFDKDVRSGAAHDIGRFTVSANFDLVHFTAWRQYPCGRQEFFTRDN